jgi:hypothetical protein
MCGLFYRHDMPDRFHFQNLFPHSVIFLWEINYILLLTIHSLYIHDLGDPKWGRTIDRPPGSGPALEADILLAKKW